MKLFDEGTGEFRPKAVQAVPGKMPVETDGGDGTALSHWDEDRFDTS